MCVTGGPTDEAHGTLNLSIQYWTSRGWAFVDVNYGGSTGMLSEVEQFILLTSIFLGSGQTFHLLFIGYPILLYLIYCA